MKDIKMKPIVLASIFSAMAMSAHADNPTAQDILTDDVVKVIADAGLKIESVDQVSTELPCAAKTFDVKSTDNVDTSFDRDLENVIEVAKAERDISIALGKDERGDVIQVMVIEDGAFITINQPDSQDIFDLQDPRFETSVTFAEDFRLRATSSEFMPSSNSEFVIVDAQQLKFCPN